jgi:acyl-CoA synthetase (AMP-forming)/AMP-acid ligase II
MLRVGDLLANSARRNPSAVALVDDGGAHLSYRQLSSRAWALARGLLREGLGRGAAVGVLSGNSAFAAETYLGIAAAGAVCVPYNWRWTPRELGFALRDSGVRLLLVERPYADAAEAALAALDDLSGEDIKSLVQGPAYEALLRPGPMPEVPGGPEDPHLVLFTGGTTGFPKGALLSHRNVVANALNEIVDTAMTPSDRTLLITPMFHSASLLCWFLPHLLLGATSVLLRGFDEEQVAATIERERVTNGFMVPSMVRRLLASGELERRDLSSYRRAYVGGAAFPMPDKLALAEAMPGVDLYYQYGLTEAGPIVTRLGPAEVMRPELDGSIGREFVLTTVTVRDQDGAELPDGEVGELCVRGPNVMLGYLGRPQETVAALRGGELRSGDLASRDPSGHLWFQDRAKDMIKSGGENVYSAEVERVLLLHPAVAEAAVLGVASRDWDEEVRAVVCLRPGAGAGEAELRHFCRRHLAGYKVPKRIAFIDRARMPFNQSGKIQKPELRATDLWPDLPDPAA